MNKNEILDHFRSLMTWKKDALRATHKTRSGLFALGQLRQADWRLIPFTEMEAGLTELLTVFGPSWREHTLADPFWRLQNDGVWQVLPG